MKLGTENQVYADCAGNGAGAADTIEFEVTASGGVLAEGQTIVGDLVGAPDKFQLTPEAYREFEVFFLEWLDRNQYELEAAGSGNLRELATLCAAWRLRLDTNSPPQFDVDAK